VLENQLQRAPFNRAVDRALEYVGGEAVLAEIVLSSTLQGLDRDTLATVASYDDDGA
jgi:hypothetical protein